jgi:predicted metal-dependent hydrolase
MNANIHFKVDPVVRKNLDFALDNIGRHWFGNDPFKSRFFDSVSLLFPDGERYFIESVRGFRERIEDPKLQEDVKHFIQQEAQHSIAHSKMNDVLESHGLPVTQITAEANEIFLWMTRNFSPRFNLALTAAFEHLTALMAESFFGDKKDFAVADPYVRALLAWHAIEEMEHRDVAFDVMKTVGDVPELMRKMALPVAVLHMFGIGLIRTNELLRYDGYSRRERAQMFMQGLPWFMGAKGLLPKMNRQFMSWFKRDFHPSQHPVIAQYDVWLKVLAETQDPIQAGEAFWQAGR